MHLGAHHVGSARALPAPGDHLINRVGGPLEARLDLTIEQVPHPADHARGQGTLAAGLPEPHALDAAADENPLPNDHRHDQTWQASQ